jgi:hypothetical protein
MARQSAALVIGYGVEHYVTERDLERALAEAATGFHQGDFFKEFAFVLNS